MKWLESPNSDEHVLCDDRGTVTEYRVRRDPVTSVYKAYDGERCLLVRLAIQPCKVTCEVMYAAERSASKFVSKKPAGRYSKRGSA